MPSISVPTNRITKSSRRFLIRGCQRLIASSRLKSNHGRVLFDGVAVSDVSVLGSKGGTAPYPLVGISRLNGRLTHEHSGDHG